MSDTLELLKNRLVSLQEQRSAVMAQIDPLNEQYNALAAEIQTLVDKQKEITVQKIKIQEENKLFALDKEIGIVAKAVGSYTMN